jgi:UDP-hydrolysing UDP-N-acetyl-D-glucosamine 2-epimerase
LSNKYTICVPLVDRANYGRLKPVMQAVKDHPDLELQVLVSGSMVLERFDESANVVIRDGFEISGRVYMELEGSTPETMAKSIGFGIVEFSSELRRLKPDFLLMIGDRYEALAVTIAAAYMNVCIVHVQGGEVSGSIDESARHAITKFAQYHVPATPRAREYLIRMGEHPDHILDVGCPSSDLARTIDSKLDPAVINGRGSGVSIDLDAPFLLTVFHPTTTEYGGEEGQIDTLLLALRELELQTVMLWPNIDAGSGHINKAIRIFRDTKNGVPLRILTNLEPDDYLRVLANATCCVGNSSSFVRDAGYFGTPVALLGNRQNLREADEHVLRLPMEKDAIVNGIRKQLDHGRYQPSSLYGDGHVSKRVAQKLTEIKPYIQKHLAFAQSENL